MRYYIRGGYLLLGGSYNKDPTVQGTIFGSPIFGNPQIGGVPYFGGVLIIRILLFRVPWRVASQRIVRFALAWA